MGIGHEEGFTEVHKGAPSAAAVAGSIWPHGSLGYSTWYGLADSHACTPWPQPTIMPQPAAPPLGCPPARPRPMSTIAFLTAPS